MRRNGEQEGGKTRHPESKQYKPAFSVPSGFLLRQVHSEKMTVIIYLA